MVAVTLLSAHVAPSVDDNNRYLKVTPFRDGIRIAYTVFYGEVPGAVERRSLDDNHDGHIDRDETNRFSRGFSERVAQALTLELDGKPEAIRWQTVDVGLGSEQVIAGSFSIDLVAYVCGAPGDSHRVVLRDRFDLPKPGETEVKVEDAAGVTVQVARIGGHDDPSHDYRFVGAGGELADSGLAIEYTASDKAARLPDGCTARRHRRGTLSGWIVITLWVGATLASLGTVLFLVLRVKRPPTGSSTGS